MNNEKEACPGIGGLGPPRVLAVEFALKIGLANRKSSLGYGGGRVPLACTAGTQTGRKVTKSFF